MNHNSSQKETEQIRTSKQNRDTSSKKAKTGKSKRGDYTPFVSHSGSYHRRIKNFTRCEIASTMAMILFFLIRLSTKHYSFSSAFLKNGKAFYALTPVLAAALTVLAAAILVTVLTFAKRRKHKMCQTVLINGLLFILSLFLIWAPFPA